MLYPDQIFKLDSSNPLRISELRRGEAIAQYQLLERIGVGGQGEVWSAIDPTTRQIIALKLSEIDNLEPAQRTALQTQAKLTTRIQHPYILPVQAAGSVGSLHYLAAPYIAGGSLRDRLDQSPLSQAEVYGFAMQITSALEYLHEQDVVHRDLKPTNILIDYAEHTYLADFGLARILSEYTQPLHTGRGTPPYAPPEQHNVTTLTPQSDLFSLGIVIYELLTGQLPWKGDIALGVRQLTDPWYSLPDPCEVNPSVPVFVWANLLRFLTSADPNSRPVSAAQTRQLLQEIASELKLDLVEADSKSLKRSDPQAVLEIGLQHWHEKGLTSNHPLTLTRFALVDAAAQITPELITEPDHNLFMLHGAIWHNYQSQAWWPRVQAVDQRISICAAILEHGDEAVAERVLSLLNQDIAAQKTTLPSATVIKLLATAFNKIGKVDFKTILLAFLNQNVSPATHWQARRLNLTDGIQLAELALSDQPYAIEAAGLLGHLRDETAVQYLANQTDQPQMVSALLTIHETAQGLPLSLPAALRLRVTGQLLYQQITAQPGQLFKAYVLSAVGCLIGFIAYIYLVIRLPDFIDATRLLLAIERGVYLGLLTSFGVFAARAISERGLALTPPLRSGLGLLVGGVFTAIALISYDVLFLDAVPTGGLLLLFALLMVAGFSLAPLIANRIVRILVSIICCWLAVILSWQLYLATGHTPLLSFDLSWTFAQIGLTAFITAIPIGILGSWGDLR